MKFIDKLTLLILVSLMALGSLSFGQESLFKRHLSVADMKAACDNEEWVVIDARSSDEFNGWALGKVKQGGHLPGAVHFDANWLTIEVPQKAERLAKVLREKKILPSKRIVIYSASQSDRLRLARFLRSRNFKELYSFDLQEWIHHKLTLKRYPDFHRLVPPAIVKDLVDGKRPATFRGAKRIKFAEVSWGDEKASYAKGHIPGSFHVNTDHFEPPPTWYLGNTEVLTKFASDYGFQQDDTVIVSGQDVTASYRLAVVLEYMGVADVRVLNGGSSAWKRAGFALETRRRVPPAEVNFGARIPQKSSLILTTHSVKEKLAQPAGFTLVDTRTWAEFVGEKSGYSYHKHKGRIPKSKYGQGNFKGPDSMTPYRNIDGTMRSPEEILAFWKATGIDPQHHLSFYCGGGWRAAEVFTYARLMGLENSTLYSDGWIGWSNDRTNEVETGMPQR